MTTGENFSWFKQQIRRAIEDYEISDFDDENGNPIWKKVSKEKALERVISLYDQTVHDFMQINACARALETIHGELTSIKFLKYIDLHSQYVAEQMNDYHFDNDIKEQLINAVDEIM